MKAPYGIGYHREDHNSFWPRRPTFLIVGGLIIIKVNAICARSIESTKNEPFLEHGEGVCLYCLLEYVYRVGVYTPKNCRAIQSLNFFVSFLLLKIEYEKVEFEHDPTLTKKALKKYACSIHPVYNHFQFVILVCFDRCHKRQS